MFSFSACSYISSPEAFIFVQARKAAQILEKYESKLSPDSGVEKRNSKTIHRMVGSRIEELAEIFKVFF